MGPRPSVVLKRDRDIDSICNCDKPAYYVKRVRLGRLWEVEDPPPKGGGSGNGLRVLFQPKAGKMVPAPSGLQSGSRGFHPGNHGMVSSFTWASQREVL